MTDHDKPRPPVVWPQRDTTWDGIRRAEFWLVVAFCLLIAVAWAAMLALAFAGRLGGNP